jgi:hypothetical protein
MEVPLGVYVKNIGLKKILNGVDEILDMVV